MRVQPKSWDPNNGVSGSFDLTPTATVALDASLLFGGGSKSVAYRDSNFIDRYANLDGRFRYPSFSKTNMSAHSKG